MNLNQVKKLMDRKKNSSKGENGYALIIGGSEDYVGAPALAGLAALRAGCDSVTAVILILKTQKKWLSMQNYLMQFV